MFTQKMGRVHVAGGETLEPWRRPGTADMPSVEG
jgi:hypothetical protein